MRSLVARGAPWLSAVATTSALGYLLNAVASGTTATAPIWPYFLCAAMLAISLSAWGWSCRTPLTNLRLAGDGGAVFSERTTGIVLWLRIRAVSQTETVLTDWNADLTVGAATYSASHIFGEALPAEFAPVGALDAKTATVPFLGEIRGWVAFRVSVSRADAMEAIDHGQSAHATVTVRDARQRRSTTTIDLAELSRQERRDFRTS